MKLPSYKRHKDHETRLKSAFLAVKSLLELELYPAHKRELLSICIWKITEVDGKYQTRFRSERTIIENDLKNIQHEHVVERKFIVDELLKNQKITIIFYYKQLLVWLQKKNIKY